MRVSRHTQRFRSLPFYDLIDTLVHPQSIISDGVIGVSKEHLAEFKLTVDQADTLASYPGQKQVILRFCYLQPDEEQDDNFPHDALVSVNNHKLNLPPATSNPNRPNIPPKRPGIHLDITSQCKFCPYVENVISVKYNADPLQPTRSYSTTVMLAEKVSAQTLLERVEKRGYSDPSLTKKLISDFDKEVATTNLQSSLVCPLGKMRMSRPCKSKNCKHYACFDALFYLQMNEKKASWECPVCGKKAYFHELQIDGFFMDIMKNTDPSVTEVTLNSDGTWAPIVKTEISASTNKTAPELITIDDEDD